MMTINNRMALTAALAGFAAMVAPMAASAQANNRAPVQQQAPAQKSAPQSAQRQQQAPSAQQDRNNHQAAPARQTQQAARPGSYRITSTVNIRERASTNSRRVGQARAGRTVQVDRVSGNWLHIRNQGWISAQYARRA